MPTARITVKTPLGPFVVSERDDCIIAAGWGAAEEECSTPLLAAAAQQLAGYFYGGLREFALPLAPQGDPFDQAVWQEMRRIPFGGTESYGEIARRLGGDPRLVGTACGRNPIPVIIPCHRVVGQDGRTGGYSGQGGVETKRFLLVHEGALLI